MKRIIIGILCCFSLSAAQAQWTTNGPWGNSSINGMTFLRNNIFASTFSHGVYRSTSNGNSWEPTNSGIDPSLTLDIIASGNNVVVSNQALGLYVSADSGASWVKTSNYNGILRRNKNKLYLGAMGGVYLSEDHGNTWTDISGTLPGTSYVSALTANDTHVFACMGDTIYRSGNGGTTWDIINQTLPANFITRTLGSFKNTIYISDNSHTYFSTDNGTSWTQDPVADLTSIFAAADDGLYILKGDHKLYFLDDAGNSWINIPNDLPVTGIEGMIVTDKAIFVYTYMRGVYRSDDNGKHWASCNMNLPSIATDICTTGNEIFTSTFPLNVYKSGDKGKTWSARSNGIAGNSVEKIVYNGTTLFAGTEGNGVFISKDLGNTWTETNTGQYIIAMTVKDGNVFVSSTDYGPASSVYVSKDNGLSFQKITIQGIASFNDINGFLVDNNTLYACADKGIYKTEDDGASWGKVEGAEAMEDVLFLSKCGDSFFAGTADGLYVAKDKEFIWIKSDTGLPADYNSMKSAITYKNCVYVGTWNHGLFRTCNNGANWEPIDGLPEYISVMSMLIQDDIFYAATSADIWQRPVSQMTGIRTNMPVEGDISVYPNPFRESAIIRFHTSFIQSASMNIYDAKGVLKRSYPISATEGAIPVSVNDLENGVYLYGIESKTYTSPKKKMVVIK